jgi:iron complex outermembrane receptor protein
MQRLFFGLCSCFAAASGQAQPSSSEPIEEVVVIAHPLSGEGLAQAATVLEGRELDRKRASTVGETLGREAGIHSAQFGKAVGRPVIHGLGGARVRVMEDRIDAMDVSVTSADHAVTVEPFVADRVEVLKGSSALLYGSGAIGGVVDVHTGRIPHEVPDRPLTGGIETRFDSNNDGNATSGKLDGAVGDFAWHVDGTWKDGDDYEIPGFAESEGLRALKLAATSGSLGEEDEAHDRLPGSAFDSESYAVGLSRVGEWGFLGGSVSRLKADYGLPGGHGHAEDGDAGGGLGDDHGDTPTLALKQTRTDFELGILDPFGSFTSANLRLGINDYEHAEIEPDGAVATEFANEAWELRAELVYELEAWRGALGLQHSDRDFSAIGEEAYVPPVQTTDSGLFWVAERDFGGFDLEAGARIGRLEHEPLGAPSERFTTYGLSLGAVVPLGAGWRLGLLGDLSSRAPVAEELYSDGPHLATRAFEIGDPALDSEKAFNLSATLEFEGERWSLAGTVYYTGFSDFIYQQATGGVEDGLPVYVYRQEDARFVGVDASVEWRAAAWEGGDLRLRGLFDLVDAKLDVSGNDNLPRIPPMRYGVGAQMSFGPVTASLDYLRVEDQDDAAPGELPTQGYDDLQAYLGVELPFAADHRLTMFVSGRNLTDDEQRLHTSFIKDFAPAPGRTIEAGLRYLF